MNAPSKLSAYQLIVYNKAIHPELFQLKDRGTLRGKGSELEAWVTPGGHVLRFEHKSICVTELLTDQERHLPDTGIVGAFMCAGERDYESDFAAYGVRYLTSVQTETLSDSLYDDEFDSLLDMVKREKLPKHQWMEDAGRCLSLVRMERRASELSSECFHLHAQGGIVVRSQTIFEYK